MQIGSTAREKRSACAWRWRRILSLGAVALLAGSSLTALAQEPESRFEVLRTRTLFVRVDTASGQVWTVPSSGDGGWQALGAPPPALGAPQVAGRYQVRIIPTSARRGPDEGPVRLLLADGATGRGWLAEAGSDAGWTAIEEPAPGTNQSSQ